MEGFRLSFDRKYSTLSKYTIIFLLACIWSKDFASSFQVRSRVFHQKHEFYSQNHHSYDEIISVKYNYGHGRPPTCIFTLQMASSNSVGDFSPTPRSSNSKPPRAAVIATTKEGTAEELIIQNFNQIQFGNRGKIGIIGTSNLDSNQQQMIELLSYALVLSGNHVVTSGGGNGTNIAVIRGALRACNSDLLTVILPQSLFKQPAEMQMLLGQVTHIMERPEHDQMELKEAANLCNYQILSEVDRILIFAYHDSTTILGPIEDFEGKMDIIKFFLD